MTPATGEFTRVSQCAGRPARRHASASGRKTAGSISTVTENRPIEKSESISSKRVGGKGALLAEILKAHPQMNAVLFDLPETEQHARDYIAAAGLGGRCTFHAGDFFKHLPSGHDAYVMAHVLHDWSDDDAVAILRRCREAVPVEGRLLIVEAVLPDGNMPHHGKLMDLLMLTVTGGVERSQDEFAQILAQSGFTLGCVHPTTTHQSIIEGFPDLKSPSSSAAVRQGKPGKSAKKAET
jgi:hypothetical protein